MPNIKIKSTNDGCRGFRFDIGLFKARIKGLVRLRAKKSRGFNRQIGSTMTMYNCYRATLAVENRYPLRNLYNFAG